MPPRLILPGEEREFAAIVNETLAMLRPLGLPDFIEDWTPETVAGFQRAHEIWVYPNDLAGGRIDSGAVTSIRNFTRAPDRTPKPWLVYHMLPVRVSAVPREQRERFSLGALRLAIPDAAARGCVGSMCEVSSVWTDIKAFIQTWQLAQIEEEGTIVRAWMRFRPGLPEFTARTAGISATDVRR